ncbi:hypothetical protein [Actinoplanes philippinensis]|uniref:hypothetical protein n=1 Tax=Actinoplanes philippinensis TaxID=35752 RepID=UPI0033FC4FD3
MDFMADGPWNWCIADRVGPDRVMGALAGVLERPVHGMVAGADLLCDVYHVGGDFPTVVDIYLTPAGVAEETVASAVAVRLRAAVLFPDDTLNPSRYVLCEPDGTVRPVHVDERETDDGAERRHVRPCTGHDPACAAPAGCDRSRWKPDPTPERPAAA